MVKLVVSVEIRQIENSHLLTTFQCLCQAPVCIITVSESQSQNIFLESNNLLIFGNPNNT